jgi:prepilin-type N-terminal cleavage/methylation domain-containing protein/prepilin-type processing-associated H-X9-DG protein
MKRRAFTLIEILVVIAIIALLAAIIFPVFSRARESARAISCLSNLKQIGMGLAMYSEDYAGRYPIAGGEISWDAVDSSTGNGPWMQQMQSYLKNRQVFHCPSDGDSEYSYFLGSRAAYVAVTPPAFAATDTRRIEYPTAFVVSGDTFSRNGSFEVTDADKDDYSQNCVGGEVNGTPSIEWQRHNGGQNILFADGHAKRFTRYNPELMTFRYDSMHGWQ